MSTLRPNSFSDKLAAIGLPITTVRHKAFIALYCAPRRGFAVVLVPCADTSSALVDPPKTGLSHGLQLERNSWQQLTDWLAGPLAPRICFGSTYVSVAQLPPVPAAVADPVVDPMPLRTNTYDSPDGTYAESTDPAAATDDTGPDIVTLRRELPGQISDQAAVVRGGSMASDVVAGIASQVGRVEQSPESPTMFPPSCLLGKDCEERTVSPLVGTNDTAVTIRTAGSIVTQRPSVWTISGLLWPILAAVLVIVVGCALKRQFRYDKSLLHTARVGLQRGEFHVECQPVVGVRRVRCIGVDALLRWDNQKYGVLDPAHYMKFIENSSLIGPMTRFTLSHTAQDLRGIDASRSLYLGVTAPASYLVSPTFIAGVGDVDSLGLPPLVLKIRADSARKFRNRLIPMMAQVRDRGMRFVPSAVHPADVRPELSAGMSFEMMKIDRDVLRVDSDEHSRQISALTRLVHQVDAVVVVEGIEIAAHHSVAWAGRAEFRQEFFYNSVLGASRLKAFLEAANAPS